MSHWRASLFCGMILLNDLFAIVCVCVCIPLLSFFSWWAIVQLLFPIMWPRKSVWESAMLDQELRNKFISRDGLKANSAALACLYGTQKQITVYTSSFSKAIWLTVDQERLWLGSSSILGGNKIYFECAATVKFNGLGCLAGCLALNSLYLFPEYDILAHIRRHNSQGSLYLFPKQFDYDLLTHIHPCYSTMSRSKNGIRQWCCCHLTPRPSWSLKIHSSSMS